LPYASLRYWVSLLSRVVCSGIDNAYPVANRGNRTLMSYDDDDWTGEPPEGRHPASSANPAFWRQMRAPISITATGVGIALIVLVIVWLL
jgi:hypothetical protein